MRLNKRARSKRNTKTINRMNRLKWREQMFEDRRKQNREASANINFVVVPYEPMVIYYSNRRKNEEIRKQVADIARVE